MSSDSVTITPEDTNLAGGNKRAILDTSFDQVTSPNHVVPAKRSNTKHEPGSSNPADNTLVTYAVFISTLEGMFDRFERKLDAKFDNLSSRLDSIGMRLSCLEEDASSRDIRIENLLSRVDEVENKGGDIERRLKNLESTAAPCQNWQPVGLPQTNILLLGDSNSGGKIRFGEDRGTLGRALPGTCEFCPKFEDLPSPDSPLFNNVSDLVLSVGTNNLKLDLSDPEPLALQMYNYVKSIARAHPGAHVFLPGVLPVNSAINDQALNTKIRYYNHYLKDMCKNLGTVTTFIDVNVFCGTDGALKQHLSKGDNDPLHLNEQGIRLFASRLKYALRFHHNMPSVTRRTPSDAAPLPHGKVPPARGQRRERGNRGSSGTRWPDIRGSYPAPFGARR